MLARFAVLLLSCVIFFSNDAAAQSSVTLYGLLDDGVTYVSNSGGHAAVLQTSGNLLAERFGFRGNEDLGGNLRAIFTLENGFTSANGALGQGGLLFGRQAFVGIGSSIGTITVGRQYDEMPEMLGPISASLAYMGFYATHMGDIDRVGGERINNAVKYVSPGIAGFTIAGLSGFGNQPGSPPTGHAISIGVKYLAGPWAVAAAFTKVSDTTFDIYTSYGLSSVNGVPAVSNASTLTTAPLQLNSILNWGVGTSYQWGNILVHGLYTQTLLDRPTFGSAVGPNARVRIGEVGALDFLKPDLSVGLHYSFTSLGSNRWHEFGSVLDYFLSKRTDAYLLAAYQRAAGSAPYAVIFTLPRSSSINQIAVRVGLRTRF
ncbi:porin [Paraburkholderia fungorum]|uniref:porin n=1 Tax=Paraburkholderia fungorum TaxID=134537 RepID=UPI00402B90F9